MTDKTIKEIIIKLNKKNIDCIKSIETISSSVDFADIILIIDAPEGKVPSTLSYYFYLIKNEIGIYVGAVYVMENDLHGYLLKKDRKKGYLTNALKDNIIKHLFKNRKEIHITINEFGRHFLAANKIAVSLGFVHEGEGSYVLKNSYY